MNLQDEQFAQIICVNCDAINEFWVSRVEDKTIYERPDDYPGYPRCIFEASLLSNDERVQTDVVCWHCNEILIENKEGEIEVRG